MTSSVRTRSSTKGDRQPLINTILDLPVDDVSVRVEPKPAEDTVDSEIVQLDLNPVAFDADFGSLRVDLENCAVEGARSFVISHKSHASNTHKSHASQSYKSRHSLGGQSFSSSLS